MNVADIREGENEFSFFDLSSTEKLLLLGPAPYFLCKSNANFDSKQNESLLYIKVCTKSILPGQKILNFLMEVISDKIESIAIVPMLDFMVQIHICLLERLHPVEFFCWVRL